MSSTPYAAPGEVAPLADDPDHVARDVLTARRVRHQAREAVALMTFSAAASTAVATAVVVLTTLGR